MSVPVRAPAFRTRAARRAPGPITVAGAALALVLASACGNVDTSTTDVALPRSVPGQPAGTIADHSANARAAGVQIPPTTSVIGGPPTAGSPLLRTDQRAGTHLPQHYLVRQGQDGSVTLTTDSAEYVAADRAPAQSVAVLEMATGSAEGGPRVRPTSLVLATVPDAEADLLAAAPTIGLDLPLRFLVWRDEQNRTQMAHPDVRRIALRHGVNPDDPAVVRLVAETGRLTRPGAGIVQ